METTGKQPLKKLLSLEIIAPVIVGIIALFSWEFLTRIFQIPPYILPGPILVIKTMITDWQILYRSLIITLQITVAAFIMSTFSGLLIAILFTQSKWIERSFFPYAVILQTTPIVAIAPLIIIWFRNDTFAALVLCATIVAFFPVLSNTTIGLKSVDQNLGNLFKLYQASPWKTLIYLRLPSALPYFLGGLRISGGLSLIGAMAAEFVAGTGGQKSGLAYQILIASYNLEIPRMFAALFLTTIVGIIIFLLLNSLSYFLLKDWHESTAIMDN